MKKFIFMIISAVILFAEIDNINNINVLRSMNINTNFIYNPDLQKTYKEYVTRKKRYFINVLENGIDILPIIINNIAKSHIPEDLVSVAMAESYFTMNARSDKRAIGLWQFMPETARRFGLRINTYVDERKDPVKSTEAAIKYLKYLHDFFGKWYLAVMAYNAGEARIVEGVVRAKVDKICKNMGESCYHSKKILHYRQIIRQYQMHGRKSFANLYALYKKLSNQPISLDELMRYQKGLKRQYIPRETRNYIIKILAMSFMLNDSQFIKYSNSYILNSGVTPEYAKVYVPAGTSLYRVAQFLGMDYRQLREYNMHLNYSFTPPYRYYIYIPYRKMAYFESHFRFKKRYIYVYRVKKGDTLIKIAKRFGTKVKIIEDYNRLGRFLRVHQKIIIPLNVRYVKYRVKRGDSLLVISKKFGVSYKKIKRINELSSNTIRVGQVLKIPQKL